MTVGSGKNPIEDWLQTLAAGLLGAMLPLVAGWTVRLFGPGILRAVSGEGTPEQVEAVTHFIAPLVVLVCSPFVVFLFARWAARLTHGSALVRATIVGLAPGALLGWVIAERAPSAFLIGAAPFKLWAILAWPLLNLGAGMLAGMLARRRQARNAA